MGKLQRALTLFLMAGFGLILSGCGGEDVFSTPPEGGTDPGTSSVASVVLLTSTPTLGSASSSVVDLTVQVKDANNALMEGQAVVFSATGGGLLVESNTTDASGVATAKLSTAGDPSNRNITVTAIAGGQSDSVIIAVTGTAVTVSGESSVVFGADISLTIFVKDSGGTGVPGKVVTVSSANGNTLSPASLVTGVSGDAQVTMTGTVGGVDTITVSALGETTTFSVTVSADQFSVTLPAADLDIDTSYLVTADWSQGGSPVADGQVVNFSATRGTLSANSATTSGGQATVNIISSTAGPVVVTAFVNAGPTANTSSDFVATTPTIINVQAAADTLGPDGQEDVITAVVRDANGNLVKNVPIRFTIVQDTSGGSISNATDVTDNLGRASTIYTSTSATTAKDGVVIRAEIEANPSLNDSVALTVAQADLFVRLGTSHLMEVLDATRYRKYYNVLVSDAGGNAAVNASVVVTLIPSWYYKGVRVAGIDPDTGDPAPPMRADWRPKHADGTFGCENEDTLIPSTALNGVLDANEDENTNGVLDPGNVASVPGTVITDETGFALIPVVFAKQYASWVDVKLRASTQVAGSEGADEVEFTLPVLFDDINSLDKPVPGATSPFGAGFEWFDTDMDLILDTIVYYDCSVDK